MVARHHDEQDRPGEVHHRARDLGAVLELELAHRLRRAVEAREVREHHRRPVPARRVQRPRHLLRGLREQRAAGPRLGAVRRAVALARHVAALDPDQSSAGMPAQRGRPRRSPSPRPPTGASARGGRRPGRPAPPSPRASGRASCARGWWRRRRSRRPSGTRSALLRTGTATMLRSTRVRAALLAAAAPRRARRRCSGSARRGSGRRRRDRRRSTAPAPLGPMMRSKPPMPTSSSAATPPEASSAARPVSTIDAPGVMMSAPRVCISIVARASQ